MAIEETISRKVLCRNGILYCETVLELSKNCNADTCPSNNSFCEGEVEGKPVCVCQLGYKNVGSQTHLNCIGKTYYCLHKGSTNVRIRLCNEMTTPTGNASYEFCFVCVQSCSVENTANR